MTACTLFKNQQGTSLYLGCVLQVDDNKCKHYYTLLTSFDRPEM